MILRISFLALLFGTAWLATACKPTVDVAGSGGGSGGQGGGGASGPGPGGSGAGSNCAGNGAACFTPVEAVPVGAHPHDLLIFDCDGDAHLDLLVANEESATLSVARGHGDGTFEFQETYDAGLSPWVLARADFNGDGRDDLAVANFIHGANVLFGDGACAFPTLYSIMGDDPLGEFSVGSLAVAAGDLDGDGHPDIVAEVSGPYGEEAFFALYWGVGDGTFLEPQYVQVGTEVADLTLADVNGDGLLDILGATSWLDGSSGAPAYLHVVLGLGNRTFAASAEFSVNGYPESFAIEDFDADGILDVVTPGSESSSVSLLRGVGDGSFQAQVTFPLQGESITGLAAGDLDGDGRKDLVVGLGADNRVAVLMGQSGKPFSDPTFVETGDHPIAGDEWEPYFVALGDLDEDGKLDIAATNFAGDVAILLSSQ